MSCLKFSHLANFPILIWDAGLRCLHIQQYQSPKIISVHLLPSPSAFIMTLITGFMSLPSYLILYIACTSINPNYEGKTIPLMRGKTLIALLSIIVHTALISVTSHCLKWRITVSWFELRVEGYPSKYSMSSSQLKLLNETESELWGLQCYWAQLVFWLIKDF